ncbi:MAG TPA: hypothetical protein VH914_16975 [Acidimicrobiia bacterium]|jgi:hypothetical protein|nr:hypothetical protein [Acidimicrobiia bacterium]
MAKSAKVFSAVAIAVASVFMGLAAPAGASHSVRMSTTTVTAAAVPNSNIKGAGATAAFKPATLKVHWSAATTQPKCTKKLVSFTITNPTKKSVTILNGKQKFAVIKPNFELGVCVYGTGKATGDLGLKGSTNVLTLKIS